MLSAEEGDTRSTDALSTHDPQRVRRCFQNDHALQWKEWNCVTVVLNIAGFLRYCAVLGKLRF